MYHIKMNVVAAIKAGAGLSHQKSKVQQAEWEAVPSAEVLTSSTDGTKL